MGVAQIQSAAFNMRLRRRSRQFANALTVHGAGLVVIGADQFGGNLQSGAMFVQSEIDGLPWVALTSGVAGATPLSGNGTMSDGGVTWQQFAGVIRAAPNTPA
jgi:hypothetical protein